MAKTLMQTMVRKYGNGFVPAHAAVYAEQVRNLGATDGDWFTQTITRPAKSKSPKQLGYYYPVVKPIISAALIALGWTVTVAKGTPYETEREWDSKLNDGTDDTDDYLKMCFAPEGKKKRDMSVEDFEEFLTGAIAFGRGPYLRCTIPDSDIDWKKHKESDNG